MALGSCREGAGTKSLRHFRHFSACLKLVRNKKVKIEKDVVGRVEMKGQNVDRDMSLWHFIYFKASVMKLTNTSPLPAVPCDWPPSPPSRPLGSSLPLHRPFGIWHWLSHDCPVTANNDLVIGKYKGPFSVSRSLRARPLLNL